MKKCIYKHKPKENLTQFNMIASKYSNGISWIETETISKEFSSFEFWNDNELVFTVIGLDLPNIKRGIEMLLPQNCTGCLNKNGQMCNLKNGIEHGWSDDELEGTIVYHEELTNSSSK